MRFKQLSRSSNSDVHSKIVKYQTNDNELSFSRTTSKIEWISKIIYGDTTFFRCFMETLTIPLHSILINENTKILVD